MATEEQRNGASETGVTVAEADGMRLEFPGGNQTIERLAACVKGSVYRDENGQAWGLRQRNGRSRGSPQELVTYVSGDPLPMSGNSRFDQPLVDAYYKSREAGPLATNIFKLGDGTEVEACDKPVGTMFGGEVMASYPLLKLGADGNCQIVVPVETTRSEEDIVDGRSQGRRLVTSVELHDPMRKVDAGVGDLGAQMAARNATVVGQVSLDEYRNAPLLLITGITKGGK
jgi:hypothetical protein